MKWILSILLILILATTALAAEERFIIVLTEEGGVQDVLTATQFAAQMQADPGVTFTAKPDYDVFGKMTLQGKMLVYIQGKSVKIVAPNEFILERAKATRYFTDLGFTVEDALLADFETVDEPERVEPVLVSEPEEEVPQCPGCLVAGECLVDGSRMISDGTYCLDGSLHPFKENTALCDASLECRSGYCDAGVCNDVTVEPPAPEPVATEKGQSIIGKFFSWLSGLFR